MTDVSARPNVIPLRRRVLAVPVAAETQTEGGIIIPESARDNADEAIVVAVGEGDYDDIHDKHIPVRNCKVGDHVLLARYTGAEIVAYIDGQKTACYIVNADDILAVVE